MIKNVFIALATIITFVNCSRSQSYDREASINDIFTKMEAQGVDTRKELLYGYFFYDKNKSKLEKLKQHLLLDKYKVVRLEIAKEGKSLYILHVEKVEVHNRQTLLLRENQLEKLAKQFGVETYDGWDVGNADPTKPLVSNASFEQTLVGKSQEEVFQLGSQLYEQEVFDKASIVFGKCIEAKYKLDTSYYKQGISLLETDNTEAGINLLHKALELNPKYYKALFNLGVNYYDRGEFQKCIDYYEKAALLNSNDDRVFYGIAAAQFVLGRVREAEVNCNKALQLNPDQENAKKLLEDIRKG